MLCLGYSNVCGTNWALYRIPCRGNENAYLPFLTKTVDWHSGFPHAKHDTAPYGLVSLQVQSRDLQTGWNRVLLMMSLTMGLRRRTVESKDNVLTDKEVEKILEKLLSSLPLIASLLTSQSSSIHFSLISVCCPSLTEPNCLPCPVMTVSSTLLSRSALGGGWQLWWVSTEAD